MKWCIVTIMAVVVGSGLYVSFTGMLPNSYIPYKMSDARTPIELTIRMSTDKPIMSRFLCFLMRSAVLFWNKEYGDIVIILDEEERNNTLAHQLGTLIDTYNFRFAYEKKPYNSELIRQHARRIKRSFGYLRQSYSSFLMDLYTSSKSIIAWIDTDASFTMPVVDRSIFTNGKLIVHGLNNFRFWWVQQWAIANKVALGFPMFADFMTYFPVYIYSQTIKNCREYIIRHMKVKNIEEAFAKMAEIAWMSPVNIILSYAYYFERDLYEWHIDTRSITLEEYNKKYLSGKHNLLPSDTLPELHVALHARYYRNFRLQHAICYTHFHIGNTEMEHCKEFKGKPNLQPFEFEYRNNHLNTWCGGNRIKQCTDMIEDRYNMFRDLYLAGKFSFDTNKTKFIDDIAEKEFQIKCSIVFSKPTQ